MGREFPRSKRIINVTIVKRVIITVCMFYDMIMTSNYKKKVLLLYIKVTAYMEVYSIK